MCSGTAACGNNATDPSAKIGSGSLKSTLSSTAMCNNGRTMTDWLDNHLFAGAWPTAVVLAGLAVGVAALAVQSGVARLLIVAALLLMGAIAAPIADRLVTTPGEHADALVRALVAAAEAGNLGAMRGCFDRDGSIHYGSTESPGMDFAEIDRGLASLRGRHRIASNRITTLDARTDAGEGIVDLSCSTETASMGGMGAVPTDWIIHVRRLPDGTWAIHRLVWTRVFRDRPRASMW